MLSPFWMCSIVFFVLLFLSTIDASCFQSSVKYTLCAAQGGSIIPNSAVFDEVELANECHEHFVETLLNKSCDHHTTHSEKEHRKPSFVQQYVYGFISVFIISALSLVGLLALPILYKISFKYVLNLFTAIAIGTLFGDAMFHLIPIVFGMHSHTLDDHHHHDHHNHDHSHDDHHHATDFVPSYQWKILLAVFILYLFYLLEVSLHWFAHYKHDRSSGHSHGHHHSHTNAETCQYSRVQMDPDIEHSHLHHNHTHHNLHQHLKTPSIYSNAKSQMNNTSAPCTPCVYSNDQDLGTNPFIDQKSKGKLLDDQLSTSPKVCNSEYSASVDNMNPILRQLTAIKSTGWMVLFGDAIHNFADGLAIGAAFSQNEMLGLTTAIAVACHELPHELGDYAVLLKSGFSHCRALLWNFLSATTAIIGFFMSSWLSVDENTRQWIFAATIGMFLYIALVDLLPTLLTDGEIEPKEFFVVNIGFLFGISMMFLLAIFEDKIIHLAIK
ncbi:unnamed protein product [Adineta ricciae]|uniref:Uncharacterized protein n=1 Tax=Adineta ricciae TaxID=249248 RepID=A0A814U3H5_ADIRI|nr:unnamed protein product [Adineta ricciae]